jgi:myo-inositol 2-dehydrogenase/D-chiro-inositol 1-dehydrogenase
MSSPGSWPSLPHPPVGIGVIGVGLIGAHHARNLAYRVPGARLVGVADPQPGLADQVAQRLACDFATRDYQQLLANPAVEAVVIATPARFHAEAVVAAADAGKSVFCEKPIAHTVADADRAINATQEAGVAFQIGFQRRFDPDYRRAFELVTAGAIGSVQLLRSTTRDPSLDQPEKVTSGAIFLETLVHDFDVLRFLAAGAEPVEVYATADALIRPDWKSRGMLDTAAVHLRFDSGAMAIVDCSFQAVYGYDVRAEVFGSAGMLSVGETSPIKVVHHAAGGAKQQRPYWFTELFDAAYVAELVHFAAAVRGLESIGCRGEDGRAALRIALAALESVETAKPVRVSAIRD